MVISSADIRKMVSESVQRVLESSIVDDVEKNFEKEVVRVCEDINNYLSKFGIRAKFNKKYDFSGYYSDSVGVYQRRSVTRNGCMRFSVNINALKAFAEEDEDIITYDDISDQIELTLWHECGHGLLEWIKQKRRQDTQAGTGIFKGAKLKAWKRLLSFNEEAVVEEFAESALFGYSSDLDEFMETYMAPQSSSI